MKPNALELVKKSLSGAMMDQGAHALKELKVASTTVQFATSRTVSVSVNTELLLPASVESASSKPLPQGATK